MPRPGDSNFDKLFKVREFIDDLKTNFQINYAPHREQAVDDAMIKLPVPKFKIVLETSLARAECWGCFGGREDVKQVWRMLTLACEWQIVIIQHEKT